MSNDNNINIGVSLNYCNKNLSEFPKELYEHKSTLISLDISANPLLDLDKTINELKEFKSLKKLKINIETGEEAKKLIQALPFLQVLNDIKILEDEDKNDKKQNINNINNKNIIIEKKDNIVINNKEKEENEEKEKEKDLDNMDNTFDKILEKIKEYDNITKEKYDLIINDYNKLLTKNKIKNILEICSYFNKILINLIKDAQEKDNIKIGSLKPLLEAQTQNEFIRINYESKRNSKKNININTSYLSIDSPREKIKQIKTETASITYLNSNKNIINNNIIHKKIIRNNSIKNKDKNKNEIRKEYSKNIKNLSLSKNKNKKPEKDSEIENNKSIKIISSNNTSNNFFTSKKNTKESNQQSRNNIRNTLNNNNNDNNNDNLHLNKKPKKKFKFTHKSHNKKILNKTSYQYFPENTEANSNTNINTETLTQTLNNDNMNNNNTIITNKIRIKSSKYLTKTISTISDTNLTLNNNNYLSKYDMLKNCVENNTINSFLNQFDQNDFNISNIFDNLKENISIDVNNIRVLNMKNILEIITQVYKQRNIRLQKKLQGMSYIKGTLETDLFSYIKSKYGLKKIIIEWILIIFSSIKAYSKINGEICLFGMILKHQLDEGSIDILQKIKETINNILNHLYKYNNKIIEKIRNNKDFMKENEWLFICQILYSNDINLREKFMNKIYEFIQKMIKNEKILEKIGKKILFSDFLNLLIMFNLRQRKKYLKNLVNVFQKYDTNKFGVINYDEFKLMIKDFNFFDKNKINDVTNYLIEKCDKETTGQITFNDVVECFDNFYLDKFSKNKNEDKIKLLDKISNLN